MKSLLLALCFTFAVFFTSAQDTFSIVAVDSITGEVGSAGASCLDNIQFPGSNGAFIISDIIPGRGALHTQAQWNAGNQAMIRQRMLAGDSPQQIIDFIKINFNDANFNSSIRQYGIADFSTTGSPRAAAFTGASCFDYKNHIVGPNYAIQGNILSGQAILDSMEARFLSTPGPLAVKLMAALQGANVPGADTRCLSNGTSSLSAFLRVAKPNDQPGAFYLDINVPSLPAGMEPIDSLQKRYDQWLTTNTSSVLTDVAIKVFPNPATSMITIDGLEPNAIVSLLAPDQRLLKTKTATTSDLRFDASAYPSGVYFVRIQTSSGKIGVQKVILEKRD